MLNHLTVNLFLFTGMVSLYYGYEYKYFKESDTKDVRPWLITIMIVTTILSLVGALIAFVSQAKGTYRSIVS